MIPQDNEHRATRAVNIGKMEKLELVQQRRLLSNIVHKLNIGDTTIGRKDPEQPSDIEVNDSYMSKRSALISTVFDGRSCTYKLTVLRATNPAYHNDNQLNIGESIYLKDGDKFRLGKTTFKMQKTK